jgi:transposase-like protein
MLSLVDSNDKVAATPARPATKKKKRRSRFRHEAFVEAFFKPGATNVSVALEVGCSVKTAGRWWSEPQNRALVAAVGREKVRAAINLASNELVGAINTLIGVHRNEDEVTYNRVKAACEIIAGYRELTQHDAIEKELAELRALAEAAKRAGVTVDIGQGFGTGTPAEEPPREQGTTRQGGSIFSVVPQEDPPQEDNAA